MDVVRFPAVKRGANDNELRFWMICVRCSNPGFVAELEAGKLMLSCAQCGHDLTAGLLELAYPSIQPTG